MRRALLNKTVTKPVLVIFFITADSYRLGFLLDFLATLMIGVTKSGAGGNGRTLILNVKSEES